MGKFGVLFLAVGLPILGACDRTRPREYPKPIEKIDRYVITVDYTKTVTEMIDAGHYDVVEPILLNENWYGITYVPAIGVSKGKRAFVLEQANVGSGLCCRYLGVVETKQLE